MRLLTRPIRSPAIRTLFALAVIALAPAALDTQVAGEVRATSDASGDTANPSAGLELVELGRRIRALQVQRSEDRIAFNERLTELASLQRTSARRIRALKEAIEKRKKELEEEQAKLAEHEAQIEAAKEQSDALVEIMKGFMTRLEAIVGEGIPWMQADRRSSVRQVAAVLDDERTDASAALAAVGRMQQEGESLGRLVETAEVDVRVGQKRLRVHGFHLGMLAVIFANEDGSVLGFAQEGQTLEDGVVSTGESELASRGYLSAVDILRRRRTPGVVDIFLKSLRLRGEVSR